MVIKCDKNYLRNKQIEISNVNFYKLVSSLGLADCWHDQSPVDRGSTSDEAAGTTWTVSEDEKEKLEQL